VEHAGYPSQILVWKVVVTITITGISRCAGNNHLTVSATIAGQSFTQQFQRADLDLDPSDREAAVLTRLRSAVKEAGATTPAQIQSALVGKTFQV
jgi:hypothetical protein